MSRGGDESEQLTGRQPPSEGASPSATVVADLQGRYIDLAEHEGVNAKWIRGRVMRVRVRVCLYVKHEREGERK